MIHRIKCFFEVQEEDATHSAYINFLENAIKETEQTCSGGVPLPEPRLRVREKINLSQMVIDPIMNDSL